MAESQATPGQIIAAAVASFVATAIVWLSLDSSGTRLWASDPFTLTREGLLVVLAMALVVLSLVAWVSATTRKKDSPWLPRWTRVGKSTAYVATIVAGLLVYVALVEPQITEGPVDIVWALILLGFLAAGLYISGTASQGGVAALQGMRLTSLTVVGTLAAVIVVGAYLYVLNEMLEATASADSDQWARLVELRGALEAIALLAVGALLGNAVQRNATSRAEAEASRAKAEAKDDAKDAEELSEVLEKITGVPPNWTMTPVTLDAPALAEAANKTAAVKARMEERQKHR